MEVLLSCTPLTVYLGGGGGGVGGVLSPESTERLVIMEQFLQGQETLPPLSRLMGKEGWQRGQGRMLQGSIELEGVGGSAGMARTGVGGCSNAMLH